MTASSSAFCFSACTFLLSRSASFAVWLEYHRYPPPAVPRTMRIERTGVKPSGILTFNPAFGFFLSAPTRLTLIINRTLLRPTQQLQLTPVQGTQLCTNLLWVRP